MNTRHTFAALAFALATSSASAASAATIFSENFNNPGFQGGAILDPTHGSDSLTSDRWFTTYYYNINSVPGWTFSGGAYLASEAVAGGGVTGDSALLLNENDSNAAGGVGGLATITISGLAVGQQYDISLLLWGDNRPTDPYVFNVAMDGVSAGSTTGIDGFPGTNPGATENYLFTATSNSEVLALSQASSSQASPIIDNVSISAVPEPALWAMMLGGFFGIGFMMRKFRTVSAFDSV